MTLDPSKKPMRMDLIDPNMAENNRLGIYKLDGDTLTFALCFHDNGSTRPTDFQPYKHKCIWVFKRKKP